LLSVKGIIKILLSNLNIEDILTRIKEIEGVKTFKEVANILSVSEVNISQWRKRGSIPYEKLIEYCKNKDIVLDWLITGRGAMRIIQSSPKQYAIVNIPPGLTREDIEDYMRATTKNEALIKEKDLLDQKIIRLEQALAEMNEEDRNRILNGFLLILGAI